MSTSDIVKGLEKQVEEIESTRKFLEVVEKHLIEAKFELCKSIANLKSLAYEEKIRNGKENSAQCI